MNVGLAIVADTRGWRTVGIGGMLAGFGLGAVAGALVMLWVRPRSRPVAAVCATTPGVAVASIALAPTVWIAVLSTTVAGLNSGPLARRMCGAGASAW